MDGIVYIPFRFGNNVIRIVGPVGRRPARASEVGKVGEFVYPDENGYMYIEGRYCWTVRLKEIRGVDLKNKLTEIASEFVAALKSSHELKELSDQTRDVITEVRMKFKLISEVIDFIKDATPIPANPSSLNINSVKANKGATMRMDKELIRQILLFLRDQPYSQFHGDLSDELVKLDGLIVPAGTEFKEKTRVLYHARLMAEAGLLQNKTDEYHLTWIGHEYADVFQDPQVWQEVCRRLEIVGGDASMEITKSLAEKIILDRIAHET